MLTSLRLAQFRCFEQLSVELPEQGAIFLGDNAQGKTSLLEAICVLIRLSSPRTKTMRTMIRMDQTELGIAGQCWQQEQQVRYSRRGLTMQLQQEEVKKRSSYLSASGLVVWMGNEDLDLVRGSSESRRRYLDFLASQIDTGYRSALSRYKKCVKARNRLLKMESSQEDALRAYAEVMLEHGEYITSVRARLVKELEPEVSRAQQVVSGRPESVGMGYISGAGEDFRTRLEESYEQERRQRQTVVGPHRDELKLEINQLAAETYASEGQQRTLALALKLAQGELLKQQGECSPVYLLDDVFGELDPKRRNALIAYLPAQAQKFITTTHLDWLDDSLKGLKQWRVTAGQLS